MILNICQLFVANLHFIRSEIVLWLARVLHRRRKQPIVWPSELIGPCVSGKILRLGMARKRRIMGWERESSTNLQPLARANAGLYVVCGSWHELDSSLEWKTSLGSILFHFDVHKSIHATRVSWPRPECCGVARCKTCGGVVRLACDECMDFYIIHPTARTSYLILKTSIFLEVSWEVLASSCACWGGPQMPLYDVQRRSYIATVAQSAHVFPWIECGAKPLQLKVSKKKLVDLSISFLHKGLLERHKWHCWELEHWSCEPSFGLRELHNSFTLMFSHKPP